MVGRS